MDKNTENSVPHGTANDVREGSATPSSTAPLASLASPAPLASSSSSHFIFVLPTAGHPYIRHEFNQRKKDDLPLGLLQESVQGFIEVYRKKVIIHPLFLSNPHWDLARQLLTVKSVTMYVNEDGLYKCMPNVATIIAHRQGECPHLCGDVALVVPRKVFEVLGKNPDDLPRSCEDDDEDEDDCPKCQTCGKELTTDEWVMGDCCAKCKKV